MISPWKLAFCIVALVALALTIYNAFVTTRTDQKYGERNIQKKTQSSSNNASSLRDSTTRSDAGSNDDNNTLAAVSPPAWFFEESKIMQSTPGSHVVSNICMRNEPSWPTDRLFLVLGNNVTLPAIKGHPHFTEFQIHSNVSDWMSIAHVARFVEEETVYLAAEEADRNPGHCMNDLVFSLAMDVFHRKKLLHERNGSSAVYPKFVHSGARTPRYDPGDCQQFCCDFISHKLELVRYPEGIVGSARSGPTGGNTGNISGQAAPIVFCFKKLVMPRVTALRYDVHLRNPQGVAALKMIQSHMFHNTTFMAERLEATPWPVQEDTVPSLNHAAEASGETIPIMLYGREDSTRRVLVNASGFKSLLENDYGVQHVDYIDGPRWTSMLRNHTAQARLYNSHRHILTLHGAHLANLFYARPGTKVFEIQCFVPRTGSHYIQQQWFSIWAPVLGISYHVYTEKVGCATMKHGKRDPRYSPPIVFISNMPEFMKQVSNFFGLQKSSVYSTTDPNDDERQMEETQISGSNASSLIVSTTHSGASSNDGNATLDALTPPAWFLEESKILFSTPGSHVVSNICMRNAPSWPADKIFLVLGNNVTLPAIKGLPYLKDFQIYSNTSDWVDLAHVASFVEEETVHFDGELIDKNPGHCTNDLVFSLAMDLVHRKKLPLGRNDITAVYPKFVYTGTAMPRYDPVDCQEFCCDFISHKLELVRYPEGLVGSTRSGPTGGKTVTISGQLQVAPTVFCFKTLVMPRVSALRYSFHLRNPPEMEVLKMIQSHMFHNTTFMSERLEATPWPVQEGTVSSLNHTTEASGETIPIMLFGREESNRRVLVNTSGFKSLLENDYGVQHVDYIDGPRWASILRNHTAQARLYNSHRHILTLHGAHLANLFYARPGTKVFEIQCWIPRSSERYIKQQWYSLWAPILGVSYHLYTEKVGCETRLNGRRDKQYSPPRVFISDMPEFMKQVSDFFGLKKSRELPVLVAR